MDKFIEQLGLAMKYSRKRLPVSAIHPELRFTRLGAVLREHATEPSDVGELAYQALTSPHDQPLELMPLHLLRDKMQEEPDHPLAKEANWANVPDALGRAQYARDALRRSPSGYSPGHVTEYSEHAVNAVKNIAEQDGVDMSDDHIEKAIGLLRRQRYGSAGNFTDAQADADHRRLLSGEFWTPAWREQALKDERFE